MQERNFEKQVRGKMEEFSLTPSEPVWKKINEQVGKKRDRRRFLLWLPLTALFLAGGIWFVSNNSQTTHNFQTKNSIAADQETAAVTKKNNEVNNHNTSEKPLPAEQNDATIVTQSTNQVESIEKEISSTSEEELPNKNKNLAERKQTFAFQKEDPSQVKKTGILIENGNEPTKVSASKKQTLNQTKKPRSAESNNGVGKPIADQEPATANSIEEIRSEEMIKKEVNAEHTIAPASTNTTDSSSNNAPVAVDLKDSIDVENAITTNRKSVSKKWKLTLEAGIGVSGVNNGIDVFKGGAQSIESNAFARDMNLNFAAPINSQVGGAPYRPPSLQKKSGYLLFGILAKKQLGKKTFFSTGLRYNFYSTTMKVGENVNRDTVVEANKSVGSFYTNSGNNFTDYNNNFHFVSVPLNFDFRVVNNLPLDLHLGLSVQQLVYTNALIYSSSSQVYYNDKNFFNKTYLSSEIGLEYSLPLSKNLSLSVGPRAGYAFSKVIKASDRHLFSYGLVTQLSFFGK